MTTDDGTRDASGAHEADHHDADQEAKHPGMPVGDEPMARGPLADLRVIELANERSAFAGKLFADAGADVILVEPPGGDRMRSYPPFLEDQPGTDRSLAFWHYHTSKRGIVLDLDSDDGRAAFRRLVAGADIVLESEEPGRLEALDLAFPTLQQTHPRLITISMAPFARSGPRAHEQATDLTLLAGGGPAWSCGYDDHTLPPVRGGGNQGYQTGCHYAFMGALTALLYRDRAGRGQHIDVDMHAAQNITTEAGSYTWLVAQQTVQRQTGRHAGVNPSPQTQVQCADGRWVTTGFPGRRGDDYRRLLGWIDELGLRDRFPEWPLLEHGSTIDRIDLSRIATDDEVRAVVMAARAALVFIASSIPAYDFFTGGQSRNFQVGIIYSPEEVMEDPHFVARGFPVRVSHPELGRTFTYPGAPYMLHGSPWRIQRRAPLLGEHTAEVLRELEAGVPAG